MFLKFFILFIYIIALMYLHYCHLSFDKDTFVTLSHSLFSLFVSHRLEEDKDEDKTQTSLYRSLDLAEYFFWFCYCAYALLIYWFNILNKIILFFVCIFSFFYLYSKLPWIGLIMRRFTHLSIHLNAVWRYGGDQAHCCQWKLLICDRDVK